MDGADPAPGPEAFFRQHWVTLAELVAAGEGACREARPESGRLGGAIREALELQLRIEEELCFPSLHSLHGGIADQVLDGVRRARSSLLEILGHVEAAETKELPGLWRSARERMKTYRDLEEQRLLPLLGSLPPVTLHEMELELEELLGKEGHLRRG
ncbi:MAG TPA: hypothetical protein VKW04_22395 [Planctomycetota bacterium]|nr:hypothetical protein [Planctomycetota bacterium]